MLCVQAFQQLQQAAPPGDPRVRQRWAKLLLRPALDRVPEACELLLTAGLGLLKAGAPSQQLRGAPCLRPGSCRGCSFRQLPGVAAPGSLLGATPPRSADRAPSSAYVCRPSAVPGSFYSCIPDSGGPPSMHLWPLCCLCAGR